jgi:hypothetical protein
VWYVQGEDERDRKDQSFTYDDAEATLLSPPVRAAPKSINTLFSVFRRPEEKDIPWVAGAFGYIRGGVLLRNEDQQASEGLYTICNGVERIRYTVAIAPNTLVFEVAGT